jgi:hypothetical protein
VREQYLLRLTMPLSDGGQTMKPLFFCVALLITVKGLAAQEIGYIDLSDGVFRESTWPRHQGGGACGSGDHPSANQSRPEVTVSLISLDETRYRIGEEVNFELKIQNTGKKTITIPWTPHLADIESGNAIAPHTYVSGFASLAFKDSQNREFQIYEILYGEKRVAGTLRALQPGQWFTVKGRKNLDLYSADWGGQELRESGAVTATVTGSYQENIVRYSPRNGGSDMARCVGFALKKGNEKEVTLEKP